MNIYLEAVQLRGTEAQLFMAAEEMGELLQKIGHFYRGRCSLDDLAEEVADVTILMRQLRWLVGYREVDNMIQSKLARLQEIIQRAK